MNIVTQEQIEEMANQSLKYAEHCNVPKDSIVFKYFLLFPLYQIGYSQKEVKEAGEEIFKRPIDSKTLRKYLKLCNINLKSNGVYLRKKNYVQCIQLSTHQLWMFQDRYGCSEYLNKHYLSSHSKETIYKNIEKVLNKHSKQKTYYGFTFQEIPKKDTRPPLKETLKQLESTLLEQQNSLERI